MNPRALILVGLLIGIFLSAVVVTTAGRTAVDATTPTPETTPLVVYETIEATPQIVYETVEVEVPTGISDACNDAILDLWEITHSAFTLLAEIEGDYYDYPNENLAEFGARVEDRLFNQPNTIRSLTENDIPDTTVCIE